MRCRHSSLLPRDMKPRILKFIEISFEVLRFTLRSSRHLCSCRKVSCKSCISFKVLSYYLLFPWRMSLQRRIAKLKTVAGILCFISCTKFLDLHTKRHVFKCILYSLKLKRLIRYYVVPASVINYYSWTTWYLVRRCRIIPLLYYVYNGRSINISVSYYLLLILIIPRYLLNKTIFYRLL